MRRPIAEAMGDLPESSTRVLDEPFVGESGDAVDVAWDDRLRVGRRAYMCPRCANIEHTDSAMAGACPRCPGLVKLVEI